MKNQVSLKSFNPQVDPQQIFKWRNDPLIFQWCRQYEELNWLNHLEWFSQVQKDPKIKMYMVYDGGTLVGVCGFTDVDWINRRAEFSLYIGPEFHGDGLGIAALGALLGHGFNALNLNCIWGECFDGNPAMKTFKKLGFKEEGRRRQFYYREGKYIDAILVSILKDEYELNS